MEVRAVAVGAEGRWYASGDGGAEVDRVGRRMGCGGVVN